MNKQDIIAFFDRCAPSWDAEMIKNDAIIEKILDNAEIEAGMDILDVACGTGVMFPYYLQREARPLPVSTFPPKWQKLRKANSPESPGCR